MKTVLTLACLALLTCCAGSDSEDYDGSVMDVTLGDLKFQVRIAAEVEHSVDSGGVKVTNHPRLEIIRLAGAEDDGSIATVEELELTVLKGKLSIGDKSFGTVAQGQVVEITPEGVFVEKELRGSL
jgi:hypothetical protein